MKIGIIGAGNMASAIINGIIASNVVMPKDLYVSDLDNNKLKVLCEKGINVYTDNTQIIKKADIVIIAVKPDIYPIVLPEIKGIENSQKKLYISIAPGITINNIKTMLGFEGRVIRTMPNTPAQVGEGMTIICSEPPATKEDIKTACTTFKAIGKTAILPEKMMDAVVAVNGSSPAYVFMFIEAMADGAVKNGIPRMDAYKIAAQSVLGAAKMVLESGAHPAELKDMVCSPGGTTIEAVKVLEQNKFRAAIIEAMDACTEKTKKLGK